jgi:branched-chain amino acid transport system substrate-binding protein
MARDAEQLGSEMTFAGGEVLRTDVGDVPLAAGTLMVGLPEWAENAEPQVVQAFNGRQIIPEGYILPAYAAVQIAAMALKPNPVDVSAALQNTQFATVLGPVKFDPKGDLAESWYRVYRYDGSASVEMERD